MRDRIFYVVCFGFIFGVLLRSFLFVDLYLTILFSLILFSLILFFSFISKNNWALIFCCFALTFCLGIFRFEARESSIVYIYDSGPKVTISGIIVDDPDIRENNQKLVVEENISGLMTKFLVTLPLGEKFRYGDEVEVSGTLEKPENFITDQGKEFDYVNYLKKDGILYTMYIPEIEVLSSGNGNKAKSALFAIKNKFLEKINFAIKSPESLLMGGLILGEKASFSDEMSKDFIDTGTIHIIALSGYNITLVSDWFFKLFSLVSINFAYGAGILSIILFVIMTGATSTAVRAGIMASLAIYARQSGRNYEVVRGLLLAGVAMVLFNPMLLVYDVSFQLSFMATVGLIFFTPKVEKYFLWAPKRGKLREIFSSTFAVYIFILPFILYKMGNLSLVALPANFLILPVIATTMALGFVTGFLGIVHYILAAPSGFMAYLLLHYELGVVKLFSSIPLAALTIPNFPLWITIAIYLWFTWKLFGSFLLPRSN